MKIIYTAQKLLSSEDLKIKQKAWAEKYIKNGKRICGRVLVSCLNLKEVSLSPMKRCGKDRNHSDNCYEVGLQSRSTKTIGEDLSNAKV